MTDCHNKAVSRVRTRLAAEVDPSFSLWAIALNPGWIPIDDHVVWDILGHHCPGTDEDVAADSNARQHHRTCGDQSEIPHRDASTERRPRTDVDSISKQTFVINSG